MMGRRRWRSFIVCFECDVMMNEVRCNNKIFVFPVQVVETRYCPMDVVYVCAAVH
jgi:hypothetical protein